MTVSVGLVGAGRMGLKYVDVLPTVPGVRLTGVLDIRTGAAQRAASAAGTQAYRDYERLLDRVDGVIVASPSETHFAYVVRALRRRRHVLVEKPVCLTSLEAEQLLRLGREAGCVVQAGHIDRYRGCFKEFLGLCREEEVRELEFFRWKGNERADVVLDLMVHDLDLAAEVSGRTSFDVLAFVEDRGKFGVSVRAQAAIAFDQGPLCLFDAWSSAFKKKRLALAYGDGVRLECDFVANQVVRWAKGQADVAYRNSEENALRTSLVGFAAAVRDGVPPLVGLGEGVAAVLACERLRAASGPAVDRVGIRASLAGGLRTAGVGWSWKDK